MRKALLATFALTILMLAADSAHACSCVFDPNEPEVNYSDWAKTFNGAAFSGRVTSVEPSKYQMISKVTFVVTERWRGIDGRTVVIFTPENSGLCGVSFEVGRDYVVIADRDEKGFSISSCPAIKYARHQAKYLEALANNKTAASPDARKFDEFGDINCEFELAKLDALAIELQNDPTSTAHIIIYGGKTGKRNAAKARAARMAYYLRKARGLDASRFKTIDGGYREKLSGEIWILSPGDDAPKATPTVSAKNVKLKGTAKIRSYNCGSEMGL